MRVCEDAVEPSPSIDRTCAPWTGSPQGKKGSIVLLLRAKHMCVHLHRDKVKGAGPQDLVSPRHVFWVLGGERKGCVIRVVTP